jgi:hypothetical protein
VPADDLSRATLHLHDDCDNECAFCALRGAEARSPMSPAEVREALGAARDAGRREITFVGGEPSLDPDLADAIRAAREIGFERVGLQTHARHLAANDLAATLAKAGLTDVHASLHGPDSATHDFHTGVPGSFVSSLAGIGAARAAGLHVVASTVLTRSNYRVLGDVPRLLGARGIAAWCVWIPRVHGRAAESPERIVPRLALALPYALHAIDTSLRRSLPAWIAGAPLCLLGPFATRALLDGPRAFGATCAECPSRPRCSGVDEWYLTRFAGDELIAREAAPAAEDHPSLRRMFVGPGRLGLSVAASPQGAPRRGLPVVR